MSADQINDTLEAAGFTVTPHFPYLVVSLKRNIHIDEVWSALYFAGTTDGWLRRDGKVWVKVL